MNRLFACILLVLTVLPGCQPFKKDSDSSKPSNTGIKPSALSGNDRQLWLDHLDKLAGPILTNLANNTLKQTMPVELSDPERETETRTRTAYLEGFGRLMSGISPWLNIESGNAGETALRNKYRELSLKAIANAVNPKAADYLEWDNGNQRLVDASFLALSVLRAPWLWEHLADSTKQQFVTALVKTRSVNPVLNNWLLNAGMIEAFFCHYGYPYDEMRLDYVLRQFDEWYVGDGMYSDGPWFHFDYYNSYVIHPFLTSIAEEVNRKKQAEVGTFQKLKSTIKGEENKYEVYNNKLRIRNDRFSVILERMINPDGTYPVIGRSLVYRGAAFHHLSDMALKKTLPPELSPGQVRTALTAVIRKTTENPNTFNSKGYLNIGLYGAQPALSDVYITTGSLYMMATILLPLGLPDTDEFWTAPAQPFTSQKIWRGENGPYDHSLEEE